MAEKQTKTPDEIRAVASEKSNSLLAQADQKNREADALRAEAAAVVAAAEADVTRRVADEKAAQVKA